MKGVLLDIEGTTTPIAFVYDVLFPFARARLNNFSPEELIARFQDDYDADVAAGMQPPPLRENPVRYVEWQMDHDRKSTSLKTLQGEIWREGFDSGALRGEVFDDVPDALRRWHAEGIDVRIYSSGSVLAQKQLFSTTRFGDLTRYLKGFFDTTTGPKSAPGSYVRIAGQFQLPPGDITFVSDSVAELRAAQQAGVHVVFSQRPGNLPQPEHEFPVITTLTQLLT